MLETIWEIFQFRKMSSTEYKADKAGVMSHANLEGIRHVSSQIENLILANQAMWELLSEKHGLTENDLLQKMNEVDLRDGKQDGKITKKRITACSDCGHKITKQRQNCYWCGSVLVTGSLFAK
ncbi:hypothetical protein NBRC116493_08940 [Aurantivibrio infirmus]